MPIPRINGVLSPVRTSLRRSWDPTRGGTITQEFESAGDSLAGLANLFTSRGIAIDWQSNPRRSRLVATATGGQFASVGITDQPIDTYQILANEIHNDLKQHPVILSMEETLPGSIVHVAADAEALTRGETIDDNWYNITAPPEAGQLLDLLKRGTTHYAIGQYVVKHTANVPNDWTGYTGATGEGAIYTTSQLIGEISTNWTFNCPTRLQVKIGNILPGSSHADYIWGWRKLPSTETSAANNRVDISFEYWWGEWSGTLYPPF